jgi:hypothetical protein
MTDTAKANAYRKDAEAGDPEAQFNLACAYANGRGVPQDDAQAMQWYRKASAQGHTGAQNNIGWMYDAGRGVTKDGAEAVRWYRKAADHGNPYAQNNLGLKYENGTGVPKDITEAGRWYRMAADQGHAQAKENLARLTPLIEERARLIASPSPKSRVGPPASDEGSSKPSKAPSHQHEMPECKTLLDACTPLVYVHNAFRISGLAVDAAARDIKRRIDDLKHAEELGDAETEHTHAFALDPPPTIEHIREAAQSLHDPERRIVEEFFWFWPAQWGGGRSDPALTALGTGDKDTAFKTWSSALANGNGAAAVVAKHNLAVMYHLVALDSEHYAMESDLTPDQLQTIAKYWRTSFKWWEDLTTDETFWSLVTDRIRMHNDPRLTTGLARRMRSTLPEALDKINAMLAIAFFEKGKHDLGKNHVTYMLETHQGQDDVAKTVGIVTKPLKTRIANAVEKARTAAERDPKKAAQSARDLLNAVAEPLKIIRMILPPADHERIDLCDSVASACLDCAMAVGRATDEWDDTLDLLDKSLTLAMSDQTRKDIETAKSDAHIRRDLSHPKVKELLEVVRRAGNLERRAKLTELFTCTPGLLSEVWRCCGKNSRAYEFCADTVAGKLREIAIEIHNAAGNATSQGTTIKFLVLSIEIHDRAASLACSVAMKERFREDESALGEVRVTLANRGMREAVRADLIREGLLPVWGNDGSPAPVLEQYRKETLGKRGDTGPQHPPPVPPHLRREHVGTPVSPSTGTNAAEAGQKKKSSNTGCLVVAVIAVIGVIIYAVSQSSSTSSTRSNYSSSGGRPSSYAPSPRPAFNEPAMALPYNGAVQRYSTAEAVAPLRIVTRSSGEHYYVKLQDYYSGRAVATVFVHGGSAAEIEVPVGSCTLKYAAGRTWYGPEYLFGPDTAYSKADQRFDFQVVGNQVSGYTVELYLQRDGNLRTSRISASEF